MKFTIVFVKCKLSYAVKISGNAPYQGHCVINPGFVSITKPGRKHSIDETTNYTGVAFKQEQKLGKFKSKQIIISFDEYAIVKGQKFKRYKFEASVSSI